MAYIGREPQIGNFQVCDAISVVNNQAAYTMQVSSVNVIPETANHCLVSLNGILQAPGSSFTVAGSTITFASALVTNDVINFIQILGSVLDLGVPSDSTVSIAKLTATGTKDATTFLRGDNTFAAAGGGKVLQVVQGTQGLFATTSTSFTSTGLDAAITPSASSSKVLVTVTMVETSNSTANKNVTATLFRGSTNLAPSGSGQHKAMGVNYNAGSGGAVNITFQFLDTPNTTNATTYTVHVAAESGATITMGINSTTSFIQLMEIGA